MSLFADDMVLYIENSKLHQKKKKLSGYKLAGYKINIQKSVAFPYTNNKVAEREIKKAIPFINNKIPRKTCNQGERIIL